jgi:hypothetical protein
MTCQAAWLRQMTWLRERKDTKIISLRQDVEVLLKYSLGRDWHLQEV